MLPDFFKEQNITPSASAGSFITRTYGLATRAKCIIFSGSDSITLSKRASKKPERQLALLFPHLRLSFNSSRPKLNHGSLQKDLPSLREVNQSWLVGAVTIFLELSFFVLALISAHQLTHRPGSCIAVLLRPAPTLLLCSVRKERGAALRTAPYCTASPSPTRLLLSL